MQSQLEYWKSQNAKVEALVIDDDDSKKKFKSYLLSLYKVGFMDDLKLYWDTAVYINSNYMKVYRILEEYIENYSPVVIEQNGYKTCVQFDNSHHHDQLKADILKCIDLITHAISNDIRGDDAMAYMYLAQIQRLQDYLPKIDIVMQFYRINNAEACKKYYKYYEVLVYGV